MKHKVGDKVIITKNLSSHKYPIGTELKILNEKEGVLLGDVKVENVLWYFIDEECELISNEKYGYLRTDEDSHNYLVPENEIELFDKLIKEVYTKIEDSDEWYARLEEFNERYSGYMLGGGTSHLKVLMP